MPKYGPETAVLVDEKTGEEIPPGSEVTDFRGNTTRFEFISILPDEQRSGKIITNDTDDPLKGREFYPGTVGAAIVVK